MTTIKSLDLKFISKTYSSKGKCKTRCKEVVIERIIHTNSQDSNLAMSVTPSSTVGKPTSNHRYKFL